MAKEIVLNQLKKGQATFNLVGKAKVSDFTFKLDVESSKENSDWVYNQMNLGIDCGNDGTIYGDMMSGYGSSRDNVVYVHGKKEENGTTKDDFKKNFTIAWDDRFDKDVLEQVGDMCFIIVGLTKDDSGKTIYKKFITQYDAIKYIEENLTDETVVNVKGNLEWSDYDETTQVKKVINSIVLSKAEEKDFRATFTQTILLDGDSIGKLDRETNTIPITAYIIESINKTYRDKSLIHKVNGKVVNRVNLPLVKIFDFSVGEDKEQAKKMLKVFKTKGKKITQLTIEGKFTKGEVNTTTVVEVDIPDDIKELIELGYVDKDEILGQIALKNGGGRKPEKMVIVKPHIKFTGTDVKIPSVDKIVDIYEEDDIDINMILSGLEISNDSSDNKQLNNSDDDLDKALESDDSNIDDDDDWLNDLDL